MRVEVAPLALASWYAGVTALAGCGGGPADASTPGELGNGQFFYGCVDAASDVACGSDGYSTHVPSTIAVGAEFRLTFQDPDGTEYPVQASAPSMLGSASSTNAFEALEPGRVGVFARSGERIVDILHLQLEPIEAVVVTHQGASLSSGLTLPTATSLGVEARPSGDLGGTLEYRWVVDDEDIVSVEATARTATLQTMTAGSTILRVTVEDALAEVPIEISEMSGPRRVPPASTGTSGASETETSGTTGADTDTSTGSTGSSSSTGGA